jgi:hypothetical protein
MVRTMKYLIFTLTQLGMAVLLAATSAAIYAHTHAASPAKSSLETHSLEVVSWIGGGGNLKVIAISNHYAYVAVGSRLQVLDISDASHPVIKGRTSTLTIDIQGMAILDSCIYIAAGNDGLFIYDISDPVQPAYVTNMAISGFTSSITINGTYAFLFTSTDLQIVDVSQPTAPEMVAVYPAAVKDIAFNGNIMYLALGDKVSIVDITDPAIPNLITDYNVYTDEIELDGNLAYLVTTSWVNFAGVGGWDASVLRIIDVSNLPNITEIFYWGDLYGALQLRNMKLIDHHLYGYGYSIGGFVSSPGYLQFNSVDVSNPVNPPLPQTDLYSYSGHRTSYIQPKIVVADHQVYLAASNTLHIYDASTNSEKGQYASWSAEKVAVANGIAYIAANSAGYLALDISVPEYPTVKGTYISYNSEDDRALIDDIAVYGPYVYAKILRTTDYGTSKVEVLDISKIASIQQVTTADLSLFPQQIHNGYGYYFDSSNGAKLKNIDLDTPTQLTPTTTEISIPTNPSGLAFSGDYAYVISQTEGLKVIDSSNPQGLVDVNQLGSPVPAYLIDSTDKALYIFTDNALIIYDLSDPKNPLLTSSTQIAGLGATNLKDMKVLNKYVYLAQANALRIFFVPDITKPAQEVTSFTWDGDPFSSIDVVGDLIYIASGEDGLLTLRHTISNPALSEKTYLPLIGNLSQALPASCTIAYRTHQENLGWLDWGSNGDESGAAGSGLRVEAIQVKPCESLPQGLGVIYQAHVQDIGWMDWVYDGQTAGTTGLGRRLEAIRFKLLNAPEGYHINYRVYIEGSGWSEIASDGEMAGTTGQFKRIEAIQINLVQP